MFSWDLKAVSDFLACDPVFEANSSYRFSFAMVGGPATLTVFPYSGEVELSIGEIHAPWAIWRLHCAAINHNDEIPEEGGAALAFVPAHARDNSHWVVLSHGASGIEIFTVFRHPTIENLTRRHRGVTSSHLLCAPVPLCETSLECDESARRVAVGSRSEPQLGLLLVIRLWSAAPPSSHQVANARACGLPLNDLLQLQPDQIRVQLLAQVLLLL